MTTKRLIETMRPIWAQITDVLAALWMVGMDQHKTEGRTNYGRVAQKFYYIILTNTMELLISVNINIYISALGLVNNLFRKPKVTRIYLSTSRQSRA